MAIKVPVFLSAPSTLNAAQQSVYDAVLRCLDDEGFQPRALGRSDFAKKDPVTEVYVVARACFGGVIMGFSQIEFEGGVSKRGSPAEKAVSRTQIPTPWNQLEAGILIALGQPIVIFAESEVSGGIFDDGAHSSELQRFACDHFGDDDRAQMKQRIRHWSAAVRTAYRN